MSLIMIVSIRRYYYYYYRYQPIPLQNHWSIIVATTNTMKQQYTTIHNRKIQQQIQQQIYPKVFNTIIYRRHSNVSSSSCISTTTDLGNNPNSDNDNLNKLSINDDYKKIIQDYLIQAKNCVYTQRLYYIHKGQTIIQLQMISQQEQQQQQNQQYRSSTPNIDVNVVMECIQYIMISYQDIVLYMKRKMNDILGYEYQSSTTIQLRIQQNNDTIRLCKEYRTRIYDSVISFYQFVIPKLYNYQQQYQQQYPNCIECISTIQLCMMNIHSYMGNVNQVQEIFDTIQQPDTTAYHILMTSYGDCNLANISETIFHTMIQNQNNNHNNTTIRITSKECISLITAWMKSTAPDAIEHALDVFKMMDTHYEMIHVRRTTTMYTTILQSLITHYPTKNVSCSSRHHVEYILNDMERHRDNDNDSSIQYHDVYYEAIKVYLHTHDYQHIDTIMLRMEQYNNIPLDASFYVQLIHDCISIGTITAANQAETYIYKYQHHISQIDTTNIQDGVVLSVEHLFMKILEIWGKSNDSTASERIGKICDYMISQQMKFTPQFFHTMIPHLANSTKSYDVDQADRLLQYNEEGYKLNHEAYVQPDYQHYLPIINSYLQFGDVEKATNVLLRQVQSCVDAKNLDIKKSISPIRPTYFYITLGWVQLDQLEHAASIIDNIQQFVDQKDIPIGPCKDTYILLIRGFEQSNLPQRDHYIQKYRSIIRKFGKKETNCKRRTKKVLEF